MTTSELNAWFETLSQEDAANWLRQNQGLYRLLWIVPHYKGKDERWESNTLGTRYLVIGLTKEQQEYLAEDYVKIYLATLSRYQRSLMTEICWFWADGKEPKHYQKI